MMMVVVGIGRYMDAYPRKACATLLMSCGSVVVRFGTFSEGYNDGCLTTMLEALLKCLGDRWQFGVLPQQ